MMVTCSACGNQMLLNGESVPPSYKCTVCGHVNTTPTGADRDDDLPVGIDDLPASGGVPLLDDDSTETPAPTRASELTVAPTGAEEDYDLEQKVKGAVASSPDLPTVASPSLRVGGALMRLAALVMAGLAITGLADSLPRLIESDRASMIFGLLGAACMGAWLLMLTKLLLSGAAALKRGDTEWRSALLFLTVTGVVGAPALGLLLNLGPGSELDLLNVRTQMTLTWVAILVLLGLGCFVLWASFFDCPQAFAPAGAAAKRVDVFSQVIVYTVLGAVSLGALALAEIQGMQAEDDQGGVRVAQPSGLSTPRPKPAQSPTPKPAVQKPTKPVETPPKTPPPKAAPKWPLGQTPATDPNYWFRVRPPLNWRQDPSGASADASPTVSRMAWTGRIASDGPELRLEAVCSTGVHPGAPPQAFGQALPADARAKEVPFGAKTVQFYTISPEPGHRTIVLVIDNVLAKRRYAFALRGPAAAIEASQDSLIAFARTIEPLSIPMAIDANAEAVACKHGKVTAVAPPGFKRRLFRDDPSGTEIAFARGPHTVLGLRASPPGQAATADQTVCGMPVRDLTSEGEPLAIGRLTWRLRSGMVKGAYRVDAWTAMHAGRQYLVYGWSPPTDHGALRVLVKAWAAKLQFAAEPTKTAQPGQPGGPTELPGLTPDAGRSNIPSETDEQAQMARALMQRNLEESGRHGLSGSFGGALVELLCDGQGRYACAVYSRRSSQVVVWSLKTGQKLVQASTRYKVGGAAMVPGTSMLVLGDSQGFLRWVPLDKMGQGQPLRADDGPNQPDQPGRPDQPAMRDMTTHGEAPMEGGPSQPGAKAATGRLSELFPVESWRASPKPIVAVAISPDKNAVAVANEDMEVWVWKAGTGDSDKLGKFTVAGSRTMRRIGFTHDSQRVSVITNQAWAEVRRWDDKKRSTRKLPVSNGGQCYDMAFSSDGRFVAVGATRGVVRTWTGDEFKPLRTLRTDDTTPTRQPPRRVRDRRLTPPSITPIYVAFSADGSRLAVARPQSIRVWGTKSWAPICKLPASAGRQRGSFRQVQFVPVSGLLLAAHSNGRVELLDLSQLILGGG